MRTKHVLDIQADVGDVPLIDIQSQNLESLQEGVERSDSVLVEGGGINLNVSSLVEEIVVAVP